MQIFSIITITRVYICKSQMIKMNYFLKRLLEAIPVFLFIITAVWGMVRFVPGGPFDKERPASEETIAALNAYYGLDKPIYEQYFSFLKNLAHGQLGPSYKYNGWKVGEILAEKAVVSLQLGSVALLIAVAIGILVGVVCAAFPKGLFGASLSAVSLLGVCLPSMVLGPILILLLSLKFKFFNSMGWNFPSDIVLPALTLSLFYIAWIARLTRSGVVEQLDKNYVKTARAKGVSEVKIYLVHILRNALEPVVSFLGPAAAGLLTGSFVVESIFQIPGLGKFFISSALDNDYTMILGCVMLYAAFILIFNLLSDVLLALINPKIAKELGK